MANAAYSYSLRDGPLPWRHVRTLDFIDAELRDGRPFPDLAHIFAVTGISKGTIQGHLNEFIRRGVVARVGSGYRRVWAS